MNRIAIVTQYHNSRNYGGTLQAYALCRVLNEMGADCEQLSYHIEHYQKNNQLKANGVRRIVKALLNQIKKKSIIHRAELFDDFLDRIPHSKRVYNDENIKEAIENYDTFITGSDQVWNMDWFHGPYFLDFVPNEKKKYSYAASMGGCSLDNEDKEYLRNVLSGYVDISVRENETVTLLEGIINRDVSLVLDPTLLLSSSEWDSVSPERIIREKYAFCYFLGNDLGIRKIAREYAKRNDLQLISISHLQNKTEKNDLFFGDKQINDATPLDFVSLVRDAEIVFTDSFHASVFSCIFQKQFFVFGRAGFPLMANRIRSLCDLFEAGTHFCDVEDKRTIKYIESAPCLLYDSKEKFNYYLKFSKEYLQRIIGKNGEKSN